MDRFLVGRTRIYSIYIAFVCLYSNFNDTRKIITIISALGFARPVVIYFIMCAEERCKTETITCVGASFGWSFHVSSSNLTSTVSLFFIACISCNYSCVRGRAHTHSRIALCSQVEISNENSQQFNKFHLNSISRWLAWHQFRFVYAFSINLHHLNR